MFYQTTMDGALRILLACLDPAPTASLFTAAGHPVVSASTPAQAIQLLQQRDVELLVTELPFPQSAQLCQTLRERPEYADLYILLIADNAEPAILSSARQIGVSDILSSPVDSASLRCRLFAAQRHFDLRHELDRRARSAAQLNAELAAANTRLEHMAITDELTGLYNRRHAIAKINEYWAIAERYGQSLACAIIDLDHFKCVNDTYGHFVGDVVLRRLASVLTETVRATDLVCRIGGEEFLIIFPAQSANQVIACAERCRTTVAAQRIVSGDDELAVTISLGIAEKRPGMSGPDDMMRLADAALYSAKRGGRNCISVAGRTAPLQPLAF